MVQHEARERDGRQEQQHLGRPPHLRARAAVTLLLLVVVRSGGARGGQERRRPYVAQAPFSSMHHDVCSLAHSRKANLILLPSKIKVSHRGCRGGQRSGHGHRGCKSRRAGEPPLRTCEEVPSLPLWARASCCRGHTG